MLKSVIIGCGNIFPMHAESIRQSCRGKAVIAGVCDNKQERAIAMGNKYTCAAYTDYREMIVKEKPDVVHVCTPHYLHKEMSVFAAEHGCHIFQEKPMALNCKETAETISAVKKAGVKFGISFQNRYNPGTVMCKKEIESGSLGKVVSARLVLCWHKPDAYYLKSDWKGTWDKEGGGVVIDQAIHSFDILRYIIGSEIDYVDCSIANRMHEKVQVEDEAAGIIMFKNSAYVNFYTICHYSYDDDVEMEVHCEKGMINIVKDSAKIWFRDKKLFNVKRAAPKPSEYIDYGEGFKDYWGYCHSIAIRRFYDAILNNTKPEIDEIEGYNTMALVDAIYESGRTGKRVYLSPGKY